MTCIIALKTKEGHNVIAGDLMASNGHHFNKIKTSKVFLKGNDCIIGFTASFRMGQILEHLWAMPPRVEGLTDEQYICSDVIDSLRKTFTSNGFGSRDFTEDIGGTFLFLYRDKLFTIQANYSVLEYEDDILAIGSGTDAALGAMYVLETPSVDEIEEYLGAVFAAISSVTPSVSEEYTYSVITNTGEVMEEKVEDVVAVEQDPDVDVYTGISECVSIHKL